MNSFTLICFMVFLSINISIDPPKLNFKSFFKTELDFLVCLLINSIIFSYIIDKTINYYTLLHFVYYTVSVFFCKILYSIYLIKKKNIKEDEEILEGYGAKKRKPIGNNFSIKK